MNIINFVPNTYCEFKIGKIDVLGDTDKKYRGINNVYDEQYIQIAALRDNTSIIYAEISKHGKLAPKINLAQIKADLGLEAFNISINMTLNQLDLSGVNTHDIKIICKKNICHIILDNNTYIENDNGAIIVNGRRYSTRDVKIKISKLSVNEIKAEYNEDCIKQAIISGGYNSTILINDSISMQKVSLKPRLKGMILLKNTDGTYEDLLELLDK